MTIYLIPAGKVSYNFPFIYMGGVRGQGKLWLMGILVHHRTWKVTLDHKKKRPNFRDVGL